MFSKCFAIEIMQTYVQQMKLNKKKLPGFPTKKFKQFKCFKNFMSTKRREKLKTQFKLDNSKQRGIRFEN